MICSTPWFNNVPACLLRIYWRAEVIVTIFSVLSGNMMNEMPQLMMFGALKFPVTLIHVFWKPQLMMFDCPLFHWSMCYAEMAHQRNSSISLIIFYLFLCVIVHSIAQSSKQLFWLFVYLMQLKGQLLYCIKRNHLLCLFQVMKTGRCRQQLVVL